MTTDPTPLSDDELSAALDGEASDEVLAAIDASPDARARQAELGAAAARVAAATVPPLDADAVDAMITAALDEPVAPSAPSGRRRTGPPVWAVAAGLLLLVATGLALVWSGRQEDQVAFKTVGASIAADEDAGGSTAESSASDQPTAGEMVLPDHGGTASGAGDGASPSTTTTPETSAAQAPLVFLGEFGSGDELRTALAASFSPSPLASTGDAPVDTPPDAAVDRCQQQLEVTLELEGGPTARGYAVVDGEDVLVYEFDRASFADGTPTQLIAAVGVDACQQVVFFER